MKYIDTSAFVKNYSEEDVEKGSDKVQSLIARAKEGKEALVSSVLLIGESVSVFDKWVRLKLLTKEDFTELLAIFMSDIRELADNGGLGFEGINSLMALFSVDYIVKYSLTLNDSFHLYSALINRHEIEEFICSDKSLNTAARNEGLKVSDPEEKH